MLKILKVTRGEETNQEIGYEVRKTTEHLGDAYMFELSVDDAKSLKEALNMRSEL